MSNCCIDHLLIVAMARMVRMHRGLDNRAESFGEVNTLLLSLLFLLHFGIGLSCVVDFVAIRELFSFIPSFSLHFLKAYNFKSSSFHCINQFHAIACQSSYISSNNLNPPLLLD
eukprot:TRINITY_DN19665_c2_g1_i2.p1 TRINITY_DN19665_c2_g1~~TRINITY_DN19665_c2_g1_i2.p1  ORF type:complete len:114 (-),score=5.02 TRINITY_DN19665_c2_g1_i2:191-532(-)